MTLPNFKNTRCGRYKWIRLLSITKSMRWSLFAETQKLKMDAFYEMFEKYIRPGNMILDLGSGSGRDSKYFHDRGYEVVAIDPSLAMCSATKKYAGVEVINCKANEIEWVDYFDGIWASASLLHVPYAEMKATLYTVMRALKPNGIMYFSVKKGQTQRLDEGRLYTDYSENSITELLTGFRYSSNRTYLGNQ